MIDSLTEVTIPNLEKIYICFEDNRLKSYFETCIFVRPESTVLKLKRAVTRCIQYNQAMINGLLREEINIRFATVYKSISYDHRIPVYRKDLELNLWENLRG